jgi:hypothetical protein
MKKGASDNAQFTFNVLTRGFIFFSQVVHSTSIMLNAEGIGATPFPSALADQAASSQTPAENYVKSGTPVDQPTGTNPLHADPSQPDILSRQIEQPSPSLSIVSGHVSESLVARVLARLSEAEWKAPLGARDDIRVAWITVLKADEGHPTPFAQAFFQYFGASPEKLIPFLAARADLDRMYAQSQAAWLEKYLPFRHHDGWRETFARIQAEIDSEALPPKKPAASAPAPKVIRRAA